MAFSDYILTLTRRWLPFFCLVIVVSGCNGAGGKLPAKTVILVVPSSGITRSGSPAENEVLAAHIAPRLREALKDEPRAVVEVLPKPTAPIEDSTQARQVGEQEGAALVLWAKSPKGAPQTAVDLYVEMLQNPETEHTLGEMAAQLDELDTLELQAIAVEDIPLEPLVSGLVDYSNGLFQDAATAFEAAKDGFEKDSLPFSGVTFLCGNTYYHLGDYRRALQEYNSILSDGTDMPGAYNNRGLTRDMLGQREEALRDLGKAIELDPGNALFYNNQGGVYERSWRMQGELERARELWRLQKAVQSLDKAIAMDPEYAQAYYNRAGTYYDQQRLDRALDDLDRAIEIKPLAEFYFNRAYMHLNLGHYEQADKDYSKAIELSRDITTQAQSLYNRALLRYYHLGEHEKGLADLDQAIKLDPGFARAYRARGAVYWEQERWEEAAQDYSKAIELEPNDAGAYVGRGSAYTELKQFEKAFQDYNKAIELEPNDFGAYMGRGSTYAQLEQYEKALQDYSKVIELEPDCAPAYLGRGHLYMRLDQIAEAIKDYDQVIKLEPGNMKAYLARGYAHRVGKQPELALQDYAKALELEADNVEAYVGRGFIYQELGEKEKAIEEYTKIIELKPDAVEISEAYYYRGMIYDERGQTWKAIRDYQRAIELKSDYVDAMVWLALAYEKVGDEAKALSMWRKAEVLETREEQKRFIEEHIANLEK